MSSGRKLKKGTKKERGMWIRFPSAKAGKRRANRREEFLRVGGGGEGEQEWFFENLTPGGEKGIKETPTAAEEP